MFGEGFMTQVEIGTDRVSTIGPLVGSNLYNVQIFIPSFQQINN